ncbi:MAG: hypothetical protein CME62_03915 [Halobacteriovoraceae bacterium]|nr:hypothetical protein [Halobacteriovoraceae bacterium]|tara:strand:+ start:9466 stop:10131 length:666 start_codon:yes stop_codon:yes gene_type:complete
MSIALIGQGLLASHLSHWWTACGVEFTQLGRGDLIHPKTLSTFQRIFLAINDDEIESFYLKFASQTQAKWIHFSGSLYIKEMIGIHPLMSFSNELYTTSFYENLLWVVDHECELDQIFPTSIKNYTKIAAELKPYYHALCVLGGNIPHLLWNELNQKFSDLGIHEQDFKKYIQITTENFLKDRKPTGPIVRNDKVTIGKNIASLQPSLAKIYQGVRECQHE